MARWSWLTIWSSICVVAVLSETEEKQSKIKMHSLTNDEIKFMMEGYESQKRPGSEDEPTDVKVNTYIKNMHFCDHKQTLTVDMALRLTWTDARLTWSSPSPPEGATAQATVSGTAVGEGMWRPDLYFTSATKVEHTEGTQAVRVTPEGEVWSSQRVRVTTPCREVDYHNFPFDEQSCGFTLSSYGHPDSEIKFHWESENPIKLRPDLKVSKFKLGDLSGVEETQEAGSGSYSVLDFKASLVRSSGFYLKRGFLPPLIAVIISFLIFTIRANCAAGIFLRGIVGFISMDIMYMSYDSLKDSLPHTQQTTALEIWGCVCGVFVLVALLETVLVYGLMHRDKRHRHAQNGDIVLKPLRSDDVDEAGGEGDASADPAISSPSKKKRMVTKLRGMAKDRMVDTIFLFIFPVIFIFLLIIYCAGYMA